MAGQTETAALEGLVQERYTKLVDLLEKRISQLESVVNTAGQKKEEKKEEKEGEKKDEKADAEKKDGDADSKAADTKDDAAKSQTGRYVLALREWKKESASYKDEVVAETSLKKDTPKGVAYIFRRVLFDSFGERRAYSELEIEDSELILALKSIIDSKYPGINFDGDNLYMQAPFPAIIHNWDKLKERAAREPESQVSKDLAHLLDRVQSSEELENYFKTRDSNIAGKSVTFETLWTVFAPKTLVVVKPFMGVPQLLQVSDAPMPYYRSRVRLPLALYMYAWCWDFDGKRMVKSTYRLRFKRFNGTKEINELDFYPVSYHSDPAALYASIKIRAVDYLKATLFCEKGAGQMFRYEGNAYKAGRKIVSGTKDDEDDDDDHKNRNNIDDEDTINAKVIPIKGEIICDAQAYLQYAHATRIHALGPMEDFSTEEPVAESDDAFANLKLEDVPKRMEERPDDFLIIPPRVLGYSTKEKLWGQFSIEKKHFLPPAGKEPKKFREDLQLDQKYKDLIEALVRSHEISQIETKTGSRSRQVKDMVNEKGKGLVLLLHGPPGVGKTLTAETIAEATGKPLFVVSVAEIGLDASRAEKNLEKLFNLATAWEAILLVDEADVFLETRGSTSDASRNALVSVLLRVLEYYQGIIILTTNRIKSIDVAVISRIHLAIRYSDLTAEQMKSIFKYFLDQLEPEWIKNRPAIDAFIDNTGHHYDLNGRQIRNVVAAALAAARHARHGDGRGEDLRLTEYHLRRVCEMTRDFQEQLKDHSSRQRFLNEASGGYGGYRG